jgi:hypothetical protein
MAVVKATVKAALLSLENDAQATEMTKDTYCDRLADIIRDAIQSGTPSGTAGGDPLIGGAIS